MSSYHALMDWHFSQNTNVPFLENSASEGLRFNQSTHSPPGQNGHHFTDTIFKCIFLNENVWIWLKISLQFVRLKFNGILRKFDFTEGWNQQYSSIGSNNGLAPARQQAIIRTNDD